MSRIALFTGTPASLWQYDPETGWMYFDQVPLGRLIEPNEAMLQRLADEFRAEAERFNRELEARA